MLSRNSPSVRNLVTPKLKRILFEEEILGLLSQVRKLTTAIKRFTMSPAKLKIAETIMARKKNI